MYKKVLVGFIAMLLAYTSVPVTSYAGVQVGDNLKLFGDLRIRFEFDERGGSYTGTSDNRERPRYRLRYGGKYQTALDNVSFGFRFATGGNLNSPHVDMDTGAGRTNHGDAFDVNRAFAVVKFGEGGKLIVGKQGYPLWQQTEVMWDGDINPEGFAVAYSASLADAGSVTAAVAYYYLDNNSWQNDFFDNDTITAWQVAHKGKFNGASTVLAVTGMHMSDGDDDADFTPTGSAATGVQEPAFYQVAGQINTEVNGLKVRVGVDYNFSDWSEATTDDMDEGYVIHGRVRTGPYGVRYYYYDIEEASVPFYGNVALTQDNFPNSNSGGLTGFEGHRIQFDYKFAKGLSADFRIYLQEGKSGNLFSSLSEVADREINRYQLNFNAKF